jgi:hypothetical protein
VRAVRPASATPANAVQRFDESAFYGVIPGTRLTFSLELVSPLPRTRETVRVPARVRAQLEHELSVIADLGYARYFLTVHGIVAFARGRGLLRLRLASAFLATVLTQFK